MMRRRPKKELSNNRDRWMVSYADFITLMFAVFVVLYAVANLSLEKHKAVMQAMNVEYANTDKKFIEKQAQKIMDDISVIQHVHKLGDKLSGSSLDKYYKKQIQTIIQKRVEQLEQKLSGKLKDKDAIDMDKHETWLEIELRSMFPSASAVPKEQAYPIMGTLSRVLSEVERPFSIGGYTDNIPIKTVHFPSNWELSAARSAAVLRLLVNEGINPTMVSAIGFGPLHPIGSNKTKEGRRLNRRIVIMVPVNGRLETRIKSVLRPYTTKKQSFEESIFSHDDFSEPVGVKIRKIKLKIDDHRIPPSAVNSKYKDNFKKAKRRSSQRYHNRSPSYR